MPRKQVERYLTELGDLADRLSSDDEGLSPAELDAALEAAGCETHALDDRFRTAVQAVADRLYDAGRTPPKYLRQLLDDTAPLEQIARSHPATAAARIGRWLEAWATTVPTVTADAAIARAYRKSAELSDADTQTLDRLEAELKERVKRRE